MSAHRAQQDLYLAASNTYVDPGDAGTIYCDRQLQVVFLITAGAETRTIAVPDKAGLIMTLTLQTDGGDCTCTVTSGYDQAGTTSLVFGDVGDWITLMSMRTGNNYRWRVLGYDGITGPTTEMATIDVDSITVDTGILPDAAGGAYLGSTTLEWGAIYQGDSTGIYWGADQDGSILHSGTSTVTLSATDLVINSTNEINVQIGGVGALAIDDAAISSNAGASATAGQDIYIETQDGGAGTGAGTAGGLLNIKTGDAGAAAAGTGNAGAAGGAFAITAGAGSAVGTQASGTANGGAGGAVTITAGAGAGGGDSSGTDGNGGNVNIVPGAKGTGGNTAGTDGCVNITGGKSVLQLGTTVEPGTTAGTDYLSMKATGTAPTGTGANAGHLYADYETDDDELFWLSGTGGTASQLTT